MAVEERKNSAARIKSNNKWTNAHYDRINIAVPKGQKDIVQNHAAARGESVNGFIGRAIGETMERDNGGGVLPETGATAETAQTPEGAAQTLTEAKRIVRAAGDVILPSLLRESVAEASRAAGETDDAFLWRAVSGQAEQDSENRKAAVNASDAPQGILIPVVVSLSLDELERVQAAAKAAGEGITDFMRRAVKTRAARKPKGKKADK